MKSKNKLKDDIDAISRGKPSRYKIGSRSVSHNLDATDRKRFEIAKQKLFLETHSTDSENLSNIWFLYCSELELPYIIAIHLDTESEIRVSGNIDSDLRIKIDLLSFKNSSKKYFFWKGNRSDAKSVLKKLVK